MNILFDLDDTLYPEKQYIYQGFWSVAIFLGHKYGLNSIDLYLDLVYIFKNGSKKVFDDFLVKRSISIKEDPLHIVHIYRNAKRNLSLYNDVILSLKDLRMFGCKLILLTNGDSQTQNRKLRYLKLDKYFDDIFVLDDYGKEYWKPSILIFEKIYNKYKGDLIDYLFLGNGQEDLEFAKKLGIQFVFVDRKNSTRKADIKNTNGVYTVRNLAEIVRMIDK